MTQPTLRTVALAAGVSRTTASDALRGRGRVSAETRRRVLAAARNLGYRASGTAHALRSGAMPQILFELDGSSTTYADGSLLQFWHRVLVGFVRTARSHGYQTSVSIDTPPNQLAAMSVEAMVYATLRPERLELPETIRFGSLFCFADTVKPPRSSDSRITTMAVGHDQRAVGATLGQHLLDLGHVKRLLIVRSDMPVRARQLVDGLLERMPDSAEILVSGDHPTDRDRIAQVLADRRYNAVLDLANFAPVIFEAVRRTYGQDVVGRRDGVTLVRLSEVPPWHLRDERVLYLSPEGLRSGSMLAEAVIAALAGDPPRRYTLPVGLSDPRWLDER